MFLRLILSVGAMVSLVALVAVAQQPPRNVLVATGRTEPVVAVDPSHPNLVVVGSNTDYNNPVAGTLPVGNFSSSNQGASFVAGTVPVRPPYTTGADPTVAIATSGTVFYSYLAETPSYCSGGTDAVVVSKSFDHGHTFSIPTIVDTNAEDDKPNMAVASEHKAHAHIFLVWTRWHSKVGSDIWFSRSTDGGATFSGPRMLYTSNLDNFGPEVVAGRQGRVYVFWSSFSEIPSQNVGRARILMAASTNDGTNFQVERTIAGPFFHLPSMVQPGSLRILTAPGVVLDSHGAIYLTWASVWRFLGKGRANSDIVLSRSFDGGHSWSKPVRINDARYGDRFMPAPAVLDDGSIGVAYYDRREGPQDLGLYAARISFRHGIQLSANVRVTAGRADVSDIYYLAPGSTCFSPGRFFGDYIGVAACPRHTLCVVWADSQRHVRDTTDIWFARVLAPLTTRTRNSQRANRVGSSERAVALTHRQVEIGPNFIHMK